MEDYGFQHVVIHEDGYHNYVRCPGIVEMLIWLSPENHLPTLREVELNLYSHQLKLDNYFANTLHRVRSNNNGI